MNDDPVFTLDQTAGYLHVSDTHVRKLTDGKVKGVPRLRAARAGRRLLFKKSWLDNWLEEVANQSMGAEC